MNIFPFLKITDMLPILFHLIWSVASVNSNNCNVVQTEAGFYCVCNSSYCDTFPKISNDRNSVYHLFTGEDSFGFNFNIIQESESSLTDAITVNVNVSDVMTKLLGFGGSFTDAFGYNLRKLNQATQQLLLKLMDVEDSKSRNDNNRSYFGSDGIRYNLCRVPMGSTDFSTHYYDYASIENDLKLYNFKLQEEDYEYKISVIHEVQEMSTKELKFITSNWSPPIWMKKNNSTNPGYLKDEFYEVYADYQIRFLEKYRSEGIEFWGMTPVNEPLTGISIHFPIDNLIMLPEQQRKWIAENLGPTLKTHGFDHLKIIALDDQRKYIRWWMDVIEGDPVAYKFTSGIGIHWYFDQFTSPEMLDNFHENYPDKFILYTESSINMLFGSSYGIGSWKRGAFYGNSIIETLNHYSSGWIDWNMALDTMGGPNYLGSFCDAPIIIDAEKDEFYKQPMYYVMGHFSTLTEFGSKILKVVKSNSMKRLRREPPKFPLPSGELPTLKEDIDVASILNPDGKLIVFVLNRYLTAKNISIIIHKENTVRKVIDMSVIGSSMNSIILFID